MNVIVFGATGMIGQGVLRECLAAADVARVLTVGRKATGQTHEKLRELAHADLLDYSAVKSELSGYDACFFCLGVSSAGLSEADYRRVTVDIGVAAAKALVELNPAMCFVFVSGLGSDAQSRTMWARVKGEAENAILSLPFGKVCAFRPAFVQPGPGIVSRTPMYRALYAVAGPLLPLVKRLAPRHVTTTDRVGRAMLNVARRGPSQTIYENADIDAAAD
jgi:uncharacterized protein YbjT (DUF2867 family)